jgi:DASS family divalent anion:Na+ symporter
VQNKKALHGIIFAFLALCIGVVIWQLGVPEGLEPKAWLFFSIFVVTIIAIVASPIPIGGIAIISLSIMVVTKVIKPADCFTGFSNPIVWLVVFAFVIARAFIESGLGKRIAYKIISKMGKSTMSLAYGLLLTDLILAPMIPSISARSGGIIFPIAKSLADEYAQRGDKSYSTGGFLMLCCYQGSMVSSAMFLTAMAGNPLIVGLASSFSIQISWLDWALVTIVPGLVSMLLIPQVIRLVHKPSILSLDGAAQLAKERLKEMGTPGSKETTMIILFLAMLVSWIIGEKHPLGVSATTTALVGVAIIVFLHVLSWDDVLKEKGAWNSMIWFAILLAYSNLLIEYGLTDLGNNLLQGFFEKLDYAYISIVLFPIFFFLHYFFASTTAYAAALYPTFLGLLIKLGYPPLLTAVALGALASLSGGLTHYGMASAPVFFGTGFLDIKRWWKVGFVVAIVNLLVWATIGTAWWKLMGLM